MVADDHPLLRQDLINSLQMGGDIEVVAEAADAQGAVEMVGEHVSDVVLLDVTMRVGGIQAARSIAVACPATRIVMLTVSEDEEALLAAMKAGARGYVLKGVSASDLTNIIRSVNNGDVYVAPVLAFGSLREMGKPRVTNPVSDLSTREQEVLELLSLGRPVEPGNRPATRAG